MKFLFLFVLSLSCLLAEINSINVQDQTIKSSGKVSFDDSFENEFSLKQGNNSWDPLKPYNVKMTAFNDYVYINILSHPIKVYRDIAPKTLRVGVSNMLTNIIFPIRFVNNILQLKIYNAMDETSRFLINSTFGIAGFFDPASTLVHIPFHNEDFGQTLGFYGASDDIHIVLPFLGSSNLRDFTGLFLDALVNPINYAYGQNYVFDDSGEYLLFQTYSLGNEYSLHIDAYENVRKDAVDLYVLLKSIYEQRRSKLVKE